MGSVFQLREGFTLCIYIYILQRENVLASRRGPKKGQEHSVNQTLTERLVGRWKTIGNNGYQFPWSPYALWGGFEGTPKIQSRMSQGETNKFSYFLQTSCQPFPPDLTSVVLVVNSTVNKVQDSIHDKKFNLYSTFLNSISIKSRILCSIGQILERKKYKRQKQRPGVKVKGRKWGSIDKIQTISRRFYIHFMSHNGYTY